MRRRVSYSSSSAAELPRARSSSFAAAEPALAGEGLEKLDGQVVEADFAESGTSHGVYEFSFSHRSRVGVWIRRTVGETAQAPVPPGDGPPC